ncbi:Diacylglycerol O-acyltransferase 1 [Taenia crassiceps]|uniref:O-acyltransferase n=1 Tax=Taenia crassiceps TaxID=6207 RepID=A0ABR4Q9A9_9CEST
MLAYSTAAALSRQTADDQPIHLPKESLLCVESGFTNFRGLINWGLIMLLVFGGKMALTNLINNGIIVDVFIWRYILQGEHAQPDGLLFIACSNIFILLGYGLELLFLKFSIPNCLCLSLVCLNLCSLVIFPSIVILSHDWSPFFTAPCISMYIVIVLKMWSYAQVNSWCRSAIKHRNKGASIMGTDLLKADHSVHKRKQNASEGKTMRSQSTAKCPLGLDNFNCSRVDSVPEETNLGDKDNLTLGNLFYFMFAPTLCYELNFPRTFSIRKRFLLKRVLELLCLSQVIVMLVQQWMVPVLKSSVTPFIRSRWIYTLERLLNIAIPNHLIWLLCFYAIFHSYLNVLAELMKFADRCFYEDWWNASSVSQFWSSWNIPVHRWCRRHIYKPMLVRGYTRFAASCVVFFVSAFFHELMVSVPLKMPRMWAFLAMLGQQPYALLVHYYCPKGGKLGNMAMWLTLILVQPYFCLPKCTE